MNCLRSISQSNPSVHSVLSTQVRTSDSIKTGPKTRAKPTMFESRQKQDIYPDLKLKELISWRRRKRRETFVLLANSWYGLLAIPASSALKRGLEDVVVVAVCSLQIVAVVAAGERRSLPGRHKRTRRFAYRLWLQQQLQKCVCVRTCVRTHA